MPKKFRLPQKVWVLFTAEGFPNGVTKDAKEAKEWEKDGVIAPYSKAPKKSTKRSS